MVVFIKMFVVEIKDLLEYPRFGQSWWKNKKHCQKSRELRTELVEKQGTLSEVEGISDRVGGKTRNIVRSRDNF